MGIALLIARVLLAIVFVVAGLAKLADRAGSRQALIDFGVPTRLAAPFGILLPLAELAVGVALIPTISAWWGALGALLLLLLFVVGISYNLARGRTPDCHCFGQLYSAPAGWSTLIRNALLAAVAAFVVVFGRINSGPNAFDWLSALTVAQRIELLVGVIVVAVLVLESWILFQMLRQQGRLLLRIEGVETQLAAQGIASPAAPGAEQTVPDRGLPIGTAAPSFGLAGLHGETLTLDALRAPGKSVLLVFSDPGCGPCTALLPEISRWQCDYASKLSLAFISRGTPEANRAKVTEHGITQTLLQKDREVAQAFQVSGTPTAVLVRADGTIGSPLAEGAEAIRALVAGAVGLPVLRSLPMTAPTNGRAASNSPPALRQGDPAPTFTLPDLEGKAVDLADFQGSPTLVLFWNPGCGFCQRMLDDLKAWETKPPKRAPKLLVVSTGAVEANKALGLRSPLVLDAGFTVGPRFGANGTPMAVLVDEEGKVASELVAGAPAVLTLAASGQEHDKAAST